MGKQSLQSDMVANDDDENDDNLPLANVFLKKGKSVSTIRKECTDDSLTVSFNI